VTLDYQWGEGHALDVRFGYLDRSVAAPRATHPQLVVNSEHDSMLRALRQQLRLPGSFLFSVAFVTPRAIALLKQELIDFSGRGVIVTSDYLGFNSPEAFAELLNLERLGIETRIHRETAFHPKGYLFQRADGITAILGSSNLTEQALVANHEWNLRVSARSSSDLAAQFEDLKSAQLAESDPLTSGWIDEYRSSYVAPVRVGSPSRRRPADHPAATFEIQPNAMQVEALAAIAVERDQGARRALIVSATGTGKTILAALDVRAVAPERVLFLVHREQILDRAIAEFQRVLGEPLDVFGKVAGGLRQIDRKYVFATIQSMSRPDGLRSVHPESFDYVLIDEAHRVGAETYGRIIDHLRPSFMLGMTATPERSDGYDVFKRFDHVVPYEIRLNAALENDLLAPFHYFGVADAEFDDGRVVDDETGFESLVGKARVRHVVQALEHYGQAGVPARGLIFCSRNEEARRLSTALNDQTVRGRRLRTASLSGINSVAEREEMVRALERGELDYLLTVDIFNEGVDIPTVNQVVMLRQTKSSIVFVQQLGRGLRKSPGKDYLVVIDFIGNYTNNYMVPIALFGDESLNKESLRKNLIAAEERGVLSGLSSVRFERIAQERVLRSIATTKLDGKKALRDAVRAMHGRLGRVPALWDFLRFKSVDPQLLATQAPHHLGFFHEVLGLDRVIHGRASRALALLCQEGLAAKRPHELLLVESLLSGVTRSIQELSAEFAQHGSLASPEDVRSAIRSLDLSFQTTAERAAYEWPIVESDSLGVRLTTAFLEDYRTLPDFAAAVDDVIHTGLHLIADRYDPSERFTVGRRYSRRDACRLLLWSKNVSSTVYGYKVDLPTASAPIFVTHHKSDGISASTKYQDELVDMHSMRWDTRSRRTLQSGEVAAIVRHAAQPMVFMKQDHADGADFFFLGSARAETPYEDSMLDDHGKRVSVVRMTLRFDKPIDQSLFDYFHPSVT